MARTVRITICTLLIVQTITLMLMQQTTLANTRNYEGYQAFQVTPDHKQQVEVLRGVEQQNDGGVIFWEQPVKPNVGVTLMVSPQQTEWLLELLNRFQIDYRSISDDVQQLIDNSRRREDQDLRKRGEYEFRHYQNYDEMQQFIEDLVAGHDSAKGKHDLHLSSITVATSYEKREITAIKLSVGNKKHKPVIWMMGGIHAREWIGPATLMYIANKLVSDWESGDDDIHNVLTAFDWYILPVFNVDGYVYTWDVDRLWRKTRSNSTSSATGCKGADPNRNWDFHWGGSGSGNNPCTEDYGGTEPFSETEVKQVADFLLDLKKTHSIVAFLDIHSYGQMWMSPYGFSEHKPADYFEQVRLANRTADKLASIHGTKYTVGNIAEVIYKASGNSVDWAYGVLDVRYSYAVELPPDSGSDGFLLSPDHISNVGQETYEAIKEMSIGLLELKAKNEL